MTETASQHVRAWIAHRAEDDQYLFGTSFVRENPNIFGGLEYICPERVFIQPDGAVSVLDVQ